MPGESISREDKIALFAEAIGDIPDAALKGDTILYTSINGHMYSYLSKENLLALRLPEDTRKAFLDQYHTTLMTAYGIVQREYVVVPDALLSNPGELAAWFQRSYAYVSALKPKSASKSKKKD
jgi:hypothetical protein